jgi:hypothetical protein
MFTQVLRTRCAPYLLGFALAFSAVGLQAAQEVVAPPTLAPEQPAAVVPAASEALTATEAAAACTKHCSDSWGNPQTCVTQTGGFGKYTCTTKNKLCSTPCQ